MMIMTTVVIILVKMIAMFGLFKLLYTCGYNGYIPGEARLPSLHNNHLSLYNGLPSSIKSIPNLFNSLY